MSQVAIVTIGPAKQNKISPKNVFSTFLLPHHCLPLPLLPSKILFAALIFLVLSGEKGSREKGREKEREALRKY